jgi:nickel transport system substrate-binding protein
MHKKAKKSNRFKNSFLITAVFLIMGTACAPQQEQNKTSSAIKTPKVLTVSWNKDVGDLNAHTYTPNQFFAQASVYEGLLKYGKDGKIEPSLATSWKIEENGKKITFSLRKGVKFSDGTPFTAKNAKRNFDAILKNQKAHAWMEVMNQIETTQAPTDDVFVIRLKNAYEPALQELTYIRPVRFMGDAAFPEGDDTSKGFKSPIGTGPWMLDTYEKDKQAVFKRNPYYWGTPPSIDEIRVVVIPDGEVRTLALKNGEIDLIYGIGLINLDTFKKLKEEGLYTTSVSPPLATRTMVLNTNRGPTSEIAVRRALQYGFDKKTIIDFLFHGIEPQADQLMSPNIPYVDQNIANAYPYDLIKANGILEDAGWLMDPKTQIRQKQGKPLQLSLRYLRADSVQSQLATYVKTNFKKIGVEILLLGEEEQQFWDYAFKGDFDIVFDETWGAPYDPHSYLSAMRKDEHSSSSFQAQKGLGIRTQLHAWIDQALVTLDETQRRTLYRNVLQTLQDEAVYIPISYQVNVAVYDPKRITSFQFPSTHYEFPWHAIEKQ